MLLETLIASMYGLATFNKRVCPLTFNPGGFSASHYSLCWFIFWHVCLGYGLELARLLGIQFSSQIYFSSTNHRTSLLCAWRLTKWQSITDKLLSQVWHMLSRKWHTAHSFLIFKWKASIRAWATTSGHWQFGHLGTSSNDLGNIIDTAVNPDSQQKSQSCVPEMTVRFWYFDNLETFSPWK